MVQQPDEVLGRSPAETEGLLGEGADLSNPAPARHADVPARTRAGCREQGVAPEGVGVLGARGRD